MTTSAQKLVDGSLVTGPITETSSLGVVVYKEFFTEKSTPLANSITLESLVNKYEKDEVRAKYLRDARLKLANSHYKGEVENFSALRLSSGMSQTELARKIESSQPHIARIENGTNDPSTDLVARLALAIGVEEQRVFSAIRQTRKTRGNVE